MFKYLIAILMIPFYGYSDSESKTTISRIGKSCSICIEKDDVKVCKYYNKCPVKKKDE